MTIRTSQLQHFEELLFSNNDGEGLNDASCVFIASVDEEFLDYIDAIYTSKLRMQAVRVATKPQANVCDGFVPKV